MWGGTPTQQGTTGVNEFCWDKVQCIDPKSSRVDKALTIASPSRNTAKHARLVMLSKFA